MMTHDARWSGVARVVASWLGIVLAAGWAPGPAGARDEPPVALSPAEKVAWWEAQCTKLGAEVEAMEALRKDHETGNRLMRTITLPHSGSLMYDRVQALERDIARRPKDDPVARQLTAEFIPLRAQYIERMTQLIRRDEDLALRGIWDYDELVARSKRWQSLEARYPLAKAERVRACEEGERARKEVEEGVRARLAQCPGDRVSESSPRFRPDSPRGRIRIPQGTVEHWSLAFDKWTAITAEWVLRAGDRVRTGPKSSCLIEVYAPTGVPDSSLIGPESLFEVPSREGEALLLDGVIRVRRQPTTDIVRENPFDVRTPTVCAGVRGTDFILRHEARTKSDLVLVREGRVEVEAGGVVRELRAGQQVSARQGQLSSVVPLKPGTWDRLVADKRLDPAGVAGTPGHPSMSSSVPGAATPRPPSNVPSSPSGAPGSPSPRGVGPGADVTRRDLPSGPLPRGGETRVSGDTFTVQSAPALQTHQEITARPVGDFQAATQVRAGGGGSAVAGLYVTVGTPAEGRAGDLFFGMDVRGIVLQRDDGAGWRDLPRQARGVEPSVRLEVLRRAGRYEFRWNGAAVGSAADTGSPMRVFLFAGPGVRAEFSRFNVVEQVVSAPTR